MPRRHKVQIEIKTKKGMQGKIVSNDNLLLKYLILIINY